jgi:hypothetical protein
VLTKLGQGQEDIGDHGCLVPLKVRDGKSLFPLVPVSLGKGYLTPFSLNMNHIVMGTDDQRKILLAGHAMCQRQAKNTGAASAKTSTLTVGTTLATAASFLIPLFV